MIRLRGGLDVLEQLALHCGGVKPHPSPIGQILNNAMMSTIAETVVMVFQLRGVSMRVVVWVVVGSKI